MTLRAIILKGVNLRYGKLQRIKGKIKVKKIVAFDTETHIDEKGNNNFLMCCTYSDEEQRVFYNREDVQNYLLDQDSKTYNIASNLEFDFNVIFFNSEHYYRFEPIINGSRWIAVFYRKFNGKNREKVTFIDSYNYVVMSVEKMGKIVNVPKLNKPCYIGKIPRKDVKARAWINEEEGIFETLEEDEWEYLERYCMRDAEVTYKFCKLLQDGYNQENTTMKITVASSVMELYKRKYLPIELESEEQKFNNVNKLIFAGYYGGRTEIFKRGFVKNLNYYDYNSMYPSVMMEEYPNPNTVVKVKYPHKDVIEYDGVSSVIMDIEDINIPIVPMLKDKLIFPKGRIRGVYTNAEIRECLKNGYVLKKIEWSVYYKKNFLPFKEFILDKYSKRNKYKEEKNPLEIKEKLDMNSLYGKTGQRNVNETTLIDMNDQETYELITNEFSDANITLNDDSKGYMIQEKLCTSNFVRPILAVYTTAMARLKLWKDIQKYDAFYTDTDSFITRREVAESKLLGLVKKEYFIKRGILVKPKMYSLVRSKESGETEEEYEKNKNIVRLKGVPRANIQVFNDILENGHTTFMKFSKAKESIKRGINPMTKTMLTKEINLEDDKRIWSMYFTPYITDEYSRPHEVK